MWMLMAHGDAKMLVSNTVLVLLAWEYGRSCFLLFYIIIITYVIKNGQQKINKLSTFE